MNGIKYLLDTNIVIGLLQRDLIVLEILKNKQIQIGECAYSAITRMELLSFPSITPTEKESVVFLLSRMKYLTITPAIENETISFRYTHKTKLPDSIIAATTKHHRLELVTLDRKLANKLKSHIQHE
ncbi:type II toxin-antitoxin system VapC family toxin [Aphanizomenon sp. UHCC 0183]|uniref:type II toxin-antitoxin system VapC family toxin n=1 Tax=Aphanizomenon sp. UHCC 0183 TaxID=2590028 RepID=UPI0014469C67|nr:type II toxin-antitoxin system VapC family toxin [Aphanizomenon sp. UHCC 0183]MTJ29161.1 type II toxin-antitoxin system VapC family toxin [Aphanizomenon sp. UHCC 0183]